MKIEFAGFVEESLKRTSYDLEASGLQEVLSLLKLHEGEEAVHNLLLNPHYYVLGKTSNPEDIVALQPEVIFSDFQGYDILVIVPEIGGEIPVPIILATAFGAFAAGSTAAAVTATALAAIGNMLFAVAIGAVMQLLAPTPEFSSDPATALNASNLFKGAPLIQEQGGSVPLIFGRPYCGGVLISSGIHTV